MDRRQLTSEDCQPSVGMIGEGTRKDGRHDGERPWFKNEMGEVVHGSVEKRRPLLIVVADHGKSGLGSPMRDLVVRSLQSHACAVTEDSSRLMNIFFFFLAFFWLFFRPFFRGPDSAGNGSNAPLPSLIPPFVQDIAACASRCDSVAQGKDWTCRRQGAHSCPGRGARKGKMSAMTSQGLMLH